MSKISTLRELLASDDDPPLLSYEQVLNNIVQSKGLGESWVPKGDTLLLQISSRSNRLARFLEKLYIYQRDHPKCPSNPRTTNAVLSLVLDILPSLITILDPEEIIHLLIPTLQKCLSHRPVPSNLRQLAAHVTDSEVLCELLLSHPSASPLFLKWVSLADAAIHDPKILHSWTTKTVKMATTCLGNHQITAETKRWKILLSLTQQLQAHHQSLVAKTGEQTKDSRRLGLGGPSGLFDSSPSSLNLSSDIVSDLKTFGLPIPESERRLQDVIMFLREDKTVEILTAVLATFPCKLCHQNVRAVAQSELEESTLVDDATTDTGSTDIYGDLFGEALGEWKILLAVPALKSLQYKAKSGLPAPIQDKLIDLASGSWSSRLAGTDRQRSRLRVPLAISKCGRNLSILWQVDVGTASGIPQQIITALQSNYTDETVVLCRTKPTLNAQRFVPLQFIDGSDITLEPSIGGLDIRTLDYETIEMANKFFALTEPLMRSVIMNDVTAEFAFDLSKGGMNVINHFKSASLILGRSGTGKTTCLVFKLVAQYLARRKISGEKPKRQVLMTRSSHLADKLRHYTRKLLHTALSNAASLEQMNDGDLGEERIDEADKSLEKTVLELKNSSFPLVCTFEAILRLLENTILHMDRKNFRCDSILPQSSLYSLGSIQGYTSSKSESKHRILIDFAAFEADFWPGFDHNNTRGFPVALVFAEIMGVIKGSAMSRKSLVPLSREQYLSWSYRIAPAFVTEPDRSRVYRIFEDYEAQKTARGSLDDVDRVFRVLRAMRDDSSIEKLLRSAFDEVYIDEVQDQRLIDIEMFLCLIKDSRGFHFAGDTAQAISQESTFRFADVKALFYEFYSAVSLSTKQLDMAQPVMFALNKNYRSHKGILALASLVMGWLWKAFPETLDRLDPEVGQLLGPKPVLFLDCDATLLVSSNVGHVSLQDSNADFGAEQVILVHDEAAKTALQLKIGHTALILTILQSKGMEFDDVIIWNFFTDCPYGAGFRSLATLGNDDSGIFDARKHIRMCSILKSLYVAVTRPRIQLYFVEGADEDIAIIEKLLTQETQEPLVEVARPCDPSFSELLKALRPGRSDDPDRWEFRGDQLMRQCSYEDAAFCYKKAGAQNKKCAAEGRIQEKQGRSCHASGDLDGFKTFIEAAISLFLEAGSIQDAADNLIRMDRHEQAAEIWLEDGHPEKAAPLYKQAGLYPKSADSYHNAGCYDEAVAALRQGNLVNQLVSYVNLNQHLISLSSYQSCSIICKLMLKQGKIAPEHQAHAIKLLGSPEIQEKYFLQYAMLDELDASYSNRKRYLELFELRIRGGLLEKALLVPFDPVSIEENLEQKLVKVLDYVWAGYCVGTTQPHQIPVAIDSSLRGLASKVVLERHHQWKAIGSFLTSPHLRGHDAGGKSYGVLSPSIKRFVSLRSLLNFKADAASSSFDSIPFDLFQEAIVLILELTRKNDDETQSTILLLTGVWEDTSGNDSSAVLLPWTPLESSSNTDLIELSKKWILQQFSTKIVELIMAARGLWKRKWPLRCPQIYIRGFCPKINKNEPCLAHQILSSAECVSRIEDTLRMCMVLCSLTSVYYARVLPGNFQTSFLGSRRYWLERLLQDITYISPFEHDLVVIKETLTKIYNKDHTTISVALEELMYFRLNKEWPEIGNFSWILEHVQLAQRFGLNVLDRVKNTVRPKLHFVAQGQHIYGQLGFVFFFEQECRYPNAENFQSTLKAFLSSLEDTDIYTYTHMHALTAFVEILSTYLFLTTYTNAFPLTLATSEICLPDILTACRGRRSLTWEEKTRYRASLIDLTCAFCRFLSRLDIALQGQSSRRLIFSNGSQYYHHGLLQRRNIEIIVLNLIYAAESPSMFPGYYQAQASVQNALKLSSTFSRYLEFRTINQLSQTFEKSLSNSCGRNCLVLVAGDGRQGQGFTALRNQPGVKHISLHDFEARLPRSKPTHELHPPSDTHERDAKDTALAAKEHQATAKIQKWWRLIHPRNQERSRYAKSLEGRASRYFLNLCANSSNSLPMRVLFLNEAVGPYLILHDLRSSTAAQHEKLMSLLEEPNLPLSTYEEIDRIVQSVDSLETKVGDLTEDLSEKKLRPLIEQPDLAGIQRLINGTNVALKGAQDELLELTADIEKAYELVRKQAED